MSSGSVKCFEKALTIKPDYAKAHNNLGVTLQELGQLDAAVKSYEKAIVIESHSSSQDNQTGHAEPFNNLGIVLKELGQLDTSINSYEKVLAIKPDFAEAHFNLGVTLQALGQFDVAVKSFEKAIAIKPDYAEAHNNLGITLTQLGQLNSAVKCHEKALSIKPDYAEAYFNRGNALSGLKRLDEALANYERAIVLKPDIDFILGFLLHLRMDLCIWDDLPRQLDELKNKINKNIINPKQKKLGLITVGKATSETMDALERIGIDSPEKSGIGIYACTVPWPLINEEIIQFCDGFEQILIIEEKGAIVEEQVAHILFNIKGILIIHSRWTTN